MGGMWTREQNWTNATIRNTNTWCYIPTGFSNKEKTKISQTSPIQPRTIEK